MSSELQREFSKLKLDGGSPEKAHSAQNPLEVLYDFEIQKIMENHGARLFGRSVNSFLQTKIAVEIRWGCVFGRAVLHLLILFFFL